MFKKMWTKIKNFFKKPFVAFTSIVTFFAGLDSVVAYRQAMQPITTGRFFKKTVTPPASVGVKAGAKAFGASFLAQTIFHVAWITISFVMFSVVFSLINAIFSKKDKEKTEEDFAKRYWRDTVHKPNTQEA